MMGDSVDTSETALWRQAIEICESLSGLNKGEVMDKLNEMELAPSLLEKIKRIMENMSASNPLLDKHDYQSLIDNLKQGNHLIGKTIDGYEIKRLIAKGGMSTVYEAEFKQSQHQKSVAIKLLSPYGITEKAIELFNREQLILSKLSHSSIVAFHHSGVTDDGTHYLVMEYIEDAEDVVSYSHQKNLSNNAIVELVKNLCDVFSYAHENKVIHRDIKPANILVDKTGQTKVIDFGIGRLEQFEGQTVTQVFTPDAAAPEQLLGQGVSEQTDVFSLGALLLQLLVKKKPLPKTNFKSYDPQNDVKHINQLLKESSLDVDLKNIITTAMHIDPALRYKSMADFSADLSHWLNHEPVVATSDSLFYRIKKFYLRNKGLSLLLSGGVLVTLLAVIMITTLENQKQRMASQRDGSFALIEAMINQANPITNTGTEVDSEALVQSLNALAQSQSKLIKSDPELSCFFYNELGKLYHSKGLYQESLDSYLIALDSMKLFTEPDEDKYLSTELTIAHLFETTGKHELALHHGENILEKLKNNPDVDPKHRLNAFYLLSKVNQYQAKNEVAKAYGDQAIDWMKLHPEISPPLQASIYNSLAVTNRNTGNMELAEIQYNKAIEILRPIREKHIELSSTLVNYAILKGRSGDFEASEALFNESFDVIKSIDVNHPHLAMNYLPYTTLLRYTDRLDEAEQVIQSAITILKQHNEVKHLANAYMKYARIGLNKYDVDVALQNLIESYQIYIDIDGIDHPNTYDQYNMAMWILMMEPYQEYGRALMNQISTKQVSKVIGSNEYIRMQMQKSYVLNEPIEMDFPEALINNYYHQQAMLSKESQKEWITSQMAKKTRYPALIDSFLNIQLALLDQNYELLDSLCSPQQQWAISSQLAYKMKIVDSCLQQQDKISESTVEVLSRWSDQVYQVNESREELIQKLLAVMQ